MLALSAALFLLLLLALTQLFRRFLALATVAFALALLSLLPLWRLEGWFPIVKVCSILGPVCWINALRLGAARGRPWVNRPWVSWSLYGVACVNIAEIGVADLSRGRPENALAALLLAAAMPTPRRISWGFDRAGLHDWRVDFPVAWILLYTSWNACFTYAERPEFPLHTAAMLLAPLVYVAVGSADLWAIARGYTLGACLFLRGTSEAVLRWSTPWDLIGATGAARWGLANVGLLAGYLLYQRLRPAADQGSS